MIAEDDGLRTIAVLNQKGGVGKTTTTVNTAAALAALGQRVAVIDLDPQAHLTIHFGVEPQTLGTGSYEVLTQSAGFEQSLMLIRPNLWLLGANINLVGAETELVSVVGREIILREAMLASAQQFDFCLIDCAPSLGLLSLNALAAAQEVLIPLQPHFLALQGFGKLLQTVDLVNKRINRDLKVSGVVLCMFDTRASLPNEVRADIERFLDNARGSDSAWSQAQLLPTFIRRNIKLAEAPSYGQTIIEYDPTCNGAADYRNVARFFLGLEPELEGRDEPAPEAEAEPEAAVESAPVVDAGPQAVQHESESPIGSEPVTECEAKPAPELPEPHHEFESPLGPEPATEGVVQGQPEEIHHKPEPGAPVEVELEPESPWRVHPEADSTPGPEPVTEREVSSGGESEQDQSGPEYRIEPGPAPQEIHHEPESAGDSGAPGQEERRALPPYRIREIHLPAPRTYSPRPLQDKPPQPELPPEPAPRHDDVSNETPQSRDEPEQVGF